jgi:hypothetical protein
MPATVKEKVESYLASRHYTLWGSGFTITEADGRDRAAEWFVKELENIGKFLAGTEEL